MSEAIAFRIEWQLHACAIPQRPPPTSTPTLDSFLFLIDEAMRT